MKKMLLMATMAGVAFASCTNSEDVVSEAQQAREIHFTNATYSAQTRAEHDLNVAFTNSDMSVYAWLAGGNTAFMTEVLDAQGTITSGNVYYWPTDGSKIDFAAVSPANTAYAAVARTTDGQTSTTFTFDATNTNPTNVNLMYADYVKGQGSGTVALGFRHVLANLHMNVTQSVLKDDNQGVEWEVKVKSLAVQNIQNQGSMVIGWDFDVTAQDWMWSNTAGAATWSIISSETSLIENGAAKTVSTTGNYYVVPQAWNATTPQKLVVTYDVITTPENGTPSTKQYTKEVKMSDMTYNVTLTGWAMNKDITYNVSINPSEELSPISFTVSEEEWGSVTGSTEVSSK